MGDHLHRLDDLYAVLDDPTCRAVLAQLQTRRDTVTSLAAVAAEIDALDFGGRSDAAVGLHHVTLPRLDAAGLVAYDSTERTVTYQGHDGVEPWLECFDGSDR